MSSTLAPPAPSPTRTRQAAGSAAGGGTSHRRAVLAGAIGNIVEWYDWTVYALFAIYFSGQFFPSDSPTAALLATFTVFAVGFLARPLGSVLLGRIADRRGRRAALTVSVVLMAAASLGIALAPTAAMIGIYAALLLVALRLVQGLSLGGETAAVGAYLTESAPQGRRGLFGSVYPTTIMVGTLLGSAVGLVLTELLTKEEMASYGWRIPFFLGGLLGLVGFFIRRGVHETLDIESGHEPKPLQRTFTLHRRTAAIVFVIVGAVSLSFFGLVSGFPVLAQAYGVSGETAFAANTAGLVALIVLIPVFGWLSDRVGRRRILTFGLMGMAVLTVPALLLLSTGHALAAQLLIVLPQAAAQAVLMVAMIERFPTRLRGTGFGICWATSVALVGGTAPMISTWLVGAGLIPVFGWYVALWCVVAAIVAIRLRETAFSPLPQG